MLPRQVIRAIDRYRNTKHLHNIVDAFDPNIFALRHIGHSSGGPHVGGHAERRGKLQLEPPVLGEQNWSQVNHLDRFCICGLAVSRKHNPRLDLMSQGTPKDFDEFGQHTASKADRKGIDLDIIRPNQEAQSGS